MKKLLLALIFLITLTGCEKLQQDVSHAVSSTFGLQRQITLYSSNGAVIKIWTGRFQVETANGNIRFMYGGKAIIISGTYLVEEK